MFGLDSFISALSSMANVKDTSRLNKSPLKSVEIPSVSLVSTGCSCKLTGCCQEEEPAATSNILTS